MRVLRAATDLPWLPDDDLVAGGVGEPSPRPAHDARLGDWRPDVVHAHDWLVAWAGDTLADAHGVPLVATIHATERAATAATPARRARHDQRRRVVARLPAPHGSSPARGSWSRGDHGSSCPPSGAPGPQRRRPDVVVGRRAARRAARRSCSRGAGCSTRRASRCSPGRSARCARGCPAIGCVIAGRGSYLPELQSQIDIEGVSDIVHLAGFVPDDELRDSLHRAGCVVIPSLYEPFGIVALEALAAGAPLIVARTGGLAEIVDGTDAGLMFEPGNPDELAACIERVLDRRRARRRRCAARGAALLGERYTWDAIAGATTRSTPAPPPPRPTPRSHRLTPSLERCGRWTVSCRPTS